MVGAAGVDDLKVVDAGLFAAIFPWGMAVWHLSQSAVEGRCPLVSAIFDCGITAMEGLPAKLEPLTPWPWHVAQLALVALWLNVALAKVVLPLMAPESGTGLLFGVVWQLTHSGATETGK